MLCVKRTSDSLTRRRMQTTGPRPKPMSREADGDRDSHRRAHGLGKLPRRDPAHFRVSQLLGAKYGRMGRLHDFRGRSFRRPNDDYGGTGRRSYLENRQAVRIQEAVPRTVRRADRMHCACELSPNRNSPASGIGAAPERPPLTRPALRHNQRNIVVLLMRAELPHFLHNRIQQFLG